MSTIGLSMEGDGAAPGTVTLGAWRGREVKMAAVLAALDELRRGGLRTATRTTVVNLVAVAADRAEARTALEATRQFGSHHPARTLVLVPRPDDERGGFDADVGLQGGEAEGHAVWFEEVVLTVRGRAASHLDSLIEPLTLADLPTVVWWTSGLPAPASRLAAEADVVLVDSRAAAEEGASLAGLVELTRRHTVVDLSWARLLPWRQLLAGLFDGPHERPFLAGVRAAEVAGKAGPRRLLGGWLTSRLGLASSAVRLAEARHASVSLAAASAGREGTFGVERRAGERLVRARAVVDGETARTDLLVLPDASLSWSLAQALTRLERDPTWEQALQAALALE